MGSFQRRIDIRTRMRTQGDGVVRAALEDDFHHFRVEIEAIDGKVAAIAGSALRHPTTLCPSAAGPLQELVGSALSPFSYSILQYTDARQQCTHLIDLTGVAIAAMGQGQSQRSYLACISDRGSAPSQCAVLWCDSNLRLEWRFKRNTIIAPERLAGLSLGQGFTSWAAGIDDPQTAEAALILRRAIFVSGGRGIDLDVGENYRGPEGGCWVWQPERADQAERAFGSSRDYADRPDELLADSLNWLDFEEHDPN